MRVPTETMRRDTQCSDCYQRALSFVMPFCAQQATVCLQSWSKTLKCAATVDVEMLETSIQLSGRKRRRSQTNGKNKRPCTELAVRKTSLGAYDEQEMTVVSLMPLAYALPGLSSQETTSLLGDLVGLRHELSWINATHPEDTVVHPVFGWRSSLWEIKSPQDKSMVAWKSAKLFEGVETKSLGSQLWNTNPSGHIPETQVSSLIYNVTEDIRVVLETNYAITNTATMLWLEFTANTKEGVCVMRKQLQNFKDVTTTEELSSERECHGLLLRPLLMAVPGRVVRGTVVQSIKSINTRGDTATTSIDRMVTEMPQIMLQWEDAFIHGMLHSA
ncbi:hypothetical protein Poli38472_008057 [Pythium oligandrum]|uniref:Uncharacterized protein n=1 Tax=Pythium oligandrum TaxID=41045 RepID=A0A8K1FIV9_PYTOL|nr:hypothetical protein Poli38472_008057 [Pythium oligandrum]|eukprot:TMW65415.1 hypothetical protein Poli38472_008057 [Pythium oligandrum]